ncbi:hypothetical protein ACLOJK_027695 [Asimina triloba]
MSVPSEGGGGEDCRFPPFPSPTEQTVWADVSPLLAAACNDLQEGELIHGENFSLFAAMSALEIMDPKMDSGMESCGYRSVEEAIENGAAPIPLSSDRTVDTQCTIDILDHLLACEEEDLFTMAYGLPLKGVGDDKCLSLLNAVEENISRQLRACKAPACKKKVLEDIEPLQNNPDLEEGYCKALLCRLRFRKTNVNSVLHFYHVLLCMKKPQGRGLELAKKHIASCLSELDRIHGTLEFLRSSASGSHQHATEDGTTASGCQPIGFDSSLNSRLSAPTPPRDIKLFSWKEAIKYFEKLLHDLDAVCSFTLDPSLEAVLYFVIRFQKMQPDLVARAHLQPKVKAVGLQLLLVQDGKLYGWDPFYDVICRALALPELAKNLEVQKNEFVVRLGQNACFKLLKQLLVWAEEQTYWIASRFLMSGFELELYSPSEYCMVYWYMYIVFIKLLEKAQVRIAGSFDSSKRKGKKRKELQKETVKEVHISPSVLLLRCYIFLSEGLAMMLAALGNEHNIFQRPSIFNTEQETLIKCNYFGDAQRISKELRGSFSSDPDRLAELRQIEQVAEHNRIALNVIHQAGSHDPSLKVSFEFSHHPCFAVAVKNLSFFSSAHQFWILHEASPNVESFDLHANGSLLTFVPDQMKQFKLGKVLVVALASHFYDKV